MEAVQDVEEFSGPNSNEICQHDVQVQIHTLLYTFLSLENPSLLMRQGCDRLTVFVKPLGTNVFGHHRQITLWCLLPICLVIGNTCSMSRAYISSISFQSKKNSKLSGCHLKLFSSLASWSLKRMKNCRKTRSPQYVSFAQ